MCVVLQHLLPKGGVPPPVGYPLRTGATGIEPCRASGNVVAVASPVRASVPRHPGKPCAGWMPPTSSPLDRDWAAFAPTPDPTSRGFRAPCTTTNRARVGCSATSSRLHCDRRFRRSRTHRARGDFRSPLHPHRPTLRGLDARQPHRGWIATVEIALSPAPIVGRMT
jgi:hypothetical protein